MMIGTRTPTIDPWPSQMTASWLSRWKIVLPSSDTANARPRANRRAARVTMNAAIRARAISSPLNRPISPQTTERQSNGHDAAVLRAVRGEDRGQRQQRADRQVDPAADDDERHADGDQAEERARLEDVQEVVDAREPRPEHERRDDGDRRRGSRTRRCAAAWRRCVRAESAARAASSTAPIVPNAGSRSSGPPVVAVMTGSAGAG